MSPIVTKAAYGAASGILSAAVVDYHAFTQWQSFEAAKKYAWGTAAWRWIQGAVTGAIGGAGLGAMFS